MLATCEILQCFPVLWPWLVKWLLTNRFHVAEHLSSNRSQMTSKYGKNKKVAHAVLSVSLMFLPHFDVFCDLHVLLNRCMATWNLLVFFLYNKETKKNVNDAICASVLQQIKSKNQSKCKNYMTYYLNTICWLSYFPLNSIYGFDSYPLYIDLCGG